MGSTKGSPPLPSGAGFEEVPGDVKASDGKEMVLAPVSVVPKPSEVAPFLTKVYDMVSDPTTEKVISWAEGGGSFVIWDSHAFERDLLRRHFKHSNFTSFIRQLNTYGFRKVDPDRWEWANEGFVRGQKHLLKNIKRKKRSPQETRSVLQQAPVKTSPGTENIEIGKYGGLVKEVETLKRDKALLMQQLVDLRQYQQTSSLEVKKLIQRLQVMEQNQQQMMALLAIVVQNPSLLNQLVQQQQQQRRSNWWNADENKKRRFPAIEHVSITDEDVSGRGAEIIQYQPSVPGTSGQVMADEAFCLPTTQTISSPALAMPMDIQAISNVGIQTASDNIDIQGTSNNMDVQTTSNMDVQTTSNMDVQTTSNMDVQMTSNNFNTLSSPAEFFLDISALQEWGDEEIDKLFDEDGELTLAPFQNDGQVDTPLSVQDYYSQLEQDCQMEAQQNCKSPQYADVITKA